MSRGRTLVAVVALLLPSYVGSYFALSDPYLSGIDLGQGGFHSMKAAYRLGGGVARVAFWPLEMADRQFRPAFWAYHPRSCVILVYESDEPVRD
jgi:hypothetical protein